VAVSAGAEVESVCSRCGPVWHVVLAMVGSQIAKVECLECHARHRYRPVRGVAGPPARRAAGARRASPKSRAADRPAVEVNAALPQRPYASSESYQVGEPLRHPTFGEGVVEAVAAGKMTVFFPGGRRVLVQARRVAPTRDPAADDGRA
jgi:hypothetical protein